MIKLQGQYDRLSFINYEQSKKGYKDLNKRD